MLKSDPTDAERLTSRKEKKKLLARIRRMMATATPQLVAMQRRYKGDFNKRIWPSKSTSAGDFVYVKREAAQEDDYSGLKRRHKLQSKASEPYQVVDGGSRTLEIPHDGLLEKVSKDWISVAPLCPDVEYGPCPSGPRGVAVDGGRNTALYENPSSAGVSDSATSEQSGEHIETAGDATDSSVTCAEESCRNRE